MTNYNVEKNDLLGEAPITDEHVQNNKTVRKMLNERGIKPEELPPAEDIKKLERKVKSQEKKIALETETFKNDHLIETKASVFDEDRNQNNRIFQRPLCPLGVMRHFDSAHEQKAQQPSHLRHQ